MSVITIGTAQVKGKTIEVKFETEKAVFFAAIGKASSVQSSTYSGLIQEAEKHIRNASITLNVRVAQLDNGKVRFGTFKRQHASNSKLYIVWDDGEKEWCSSYTYDEFYSGGPTQVDQAPEINAMLAEAQACGKRASELYSQAKVKMGPKLNLRRIWNNALEATKQVPSAQEAAS